MGTKNISITDEAYEILKTWKKGKESFSEVIKKIGKHNDFSEFYGVFSEKRAKKIKEDIINSRKKSRERYK